MGGAYGTSTGTKPARGIALQAEGEIIVMQQCAKNGALSPAYDDVCWYEKGMFIFYETLDVPKFNVLSRKNIMLVLSAQIAIIIAFEPALSLLIVEKSLLGSAA